MTILNRVAIQCCNDKNHQMFKEVDGARCVECKSIMMPIPVSEEDYRALPSYIEWHKQRTQKPKQSMQIGVEMNTDKLQLKLRAIAKHTEALADELDAIDNIVLCPKCGSDDVCTLRLGEEQRLADATCNKCGYDLPTRLEGSE